MPRILRNPYRFRSVSKWARDGTAAGRLRGRTNRSHVILVQTLREWTRFNLEE